jgi:hypothetical protein
LTLTLDLTPAIDLKKRLTSGAFCTGLMIYLEGIAALVLLTEHQLSPAVLVPMALVLGAQILLVRHPVRLLVRDRLAASYAAFLLVALIFIALAALGSPGGEPRAVAALTCALVVAGTGWPVVSAIRAARGSRARLRGVANPAVVVACLSFDLGSAIAGRVRSFGGDRRRWAAPFVGAFAGIIATLLALGFLQQMMGLKMGALIGQLSGLAGLWAFYRTMRHAKLRGSQLRARDTRQPVLILREFDDDALGVARFNPGPSFEHFFAAELDRIGPTVSVGRPGERLAPLGASRDYLDGPDWQTRVSTMIEDAAVAAFLLGDSENLLWEFRKAMATRGRERALVIVPPLPDRAELQRRWNHFVRATANIVGPGLPTDLPDDRVLAFFFTRDDVVMFVARNRGRSQPWFSRAPGDYRLALRLFGCLLNARPASARDVESFISANLPIVEAGAAA